MPRPETYVSFETINRHVAEARYMRAMETRRLFQAFTHWVGSLAGRIGGASHGQGKIRQGHG